ERTGNRRRRHPQSAAVCLALLGGPAQGGDSAVFLMGYSSPMTNLQLLACPVCPDTALTSQGSEWVCASCAVRYPTLEGIPWLFREPQAALGAWRDRLHRLVLELGRDAQKVRAELQRQRMRTATRNRLKLLAQAY